MKQMNLIITQTMMGVLMFFFFASQVFYVFGKVIVIREPYKEDEAKLTCFSEDDGGALVWNDVISKKFMEKLRKTRFYNPVDKIAANKNKINCKMDKIDNCWESWRMEKWKFTDSLITPLGPVLDQRWEEFTEHGIYDHLNHPVEIKNATAFSLSVRVDSRMTITLCNGSKSEPTSCYSIIIGGRGNRRSAIQKCPNGIPMKRYQFSEKCQESQVSFSHEPLSSTEWRTFLVMWDSVTRNISVYDAANNTVLMKYQDNERSTSSSSYHMFLSSEDNMLYRFHIYTFLHTTTENAILKSPIFQFNDRMICIQLLVGLCAECDINIILHDATSGKELKRLIVKGSTSAKHGLPTWQFVTIEHLANRNSVIMELRSMLISNNSNPLWAIANIRQCPKYESFRRGILYVSTNPYAVPSANVTCQKLFYNDHTVVNSLSDIEPNMKLDATNCPEGRFGPRCLISCNHTSYPNNDCKSSTICYQNGCTCFPGFMGNDCSIPCQGNVEYGQNCGKICDMCMNKEESNSFCNKVTGACNYGCRKHPNKLYIPPMCQISISKSNAPLIQFINTANIQAKVPITWRQEYNGSLSYSFILQTTNNINIDRIQPASWKSMLNNVTELTEIFKNLKSNIIYYVACIFRACDRQGLCNYISSEWHIVETNCNQSNLLLKSKDHSLSINWKTELNQLYSCPVRYILIVEQADTGKSILRTAINKLPYEVSALPSYTLFNVFIFYNNHRIFSEQIRTLEEAPLQVLSPRYLNASDTTVTLSWLAPNQLDTFKYNITLRIKEYHGCKDSKFSSNSFNASYSTNDTTILIQNLHPYASYIAQVVAYNSQYMSKPEEIIFETKESDIATEKFHNVNVQNLNMTWEPPPDCKMITGQLYAKIEIQAINDDVKDLYNKYTSDYHLDLNTMQLYGAERYIAKLYVVRHEAGLENRSVYLKCEFETPVKAPPKVLHLEVYEIDSRTNPAIVHLRWQRLRPPLNGILHAYYIRSCSRNNNCNITEIQLDAVCDLWDNYICGSISRSYSDPQQTIEIVAFNMNVTEPSIPALLTAENLDTMMLPDGPANCTVTFLNDSVVDLQWSHPWKTGSPLEYFLIRVDRNYTNLKTSSENDQLLRNPNFSKVYRFSIKLRYMVPNYKRNYIKRLHLLPSTQYVAVIRAVTYTGEISNATHKSFETPSALKFDGHLTYQLSDSMISLNIPPVLNDTKNSMVHVIIKGPKPCEGYSKVPENLRAQAGVKINDDAWQAAELPTQMLVGKSFMIGNNKFYGKAKNCPLQSNEKYEIMVIVDEPKQSLSETLYVQLIMLKVSICNDVSSTYYEAWIIPLLLISLGASMGFYFYRRKMEKKYKVSGISNQKLENESTISQDVTYKETQAQVEAHDMKLDEKPSDSSQQ